MNCHIGSRILIVLLATGLIASGHLFAADPPKREAWTASRISGSPDPAPPYRVEAAFPKLKFDHPLDVTSAPIGDRLFVVEQGGKIFSFPNDQSVEKPELVIDLKQVHKDLSNAYGLTFHPDFEHNRYAYVCYVLANDKDDGSIVSRFTMSKDDPWKFDMASEEIVIRWWSGGHNGGCLKFGNDGYLFISTGDGGGPDPPDPRRGGQDVTRLLSAILRIDVDHKDGSRNYRVPADNPFLKFPEARPEIWAHGFRNPWRMSIDRKTGDLWVGDVGWQLWEMIYRVQPGGNYGWAITEGPQPVLPELPRGPTPILPPTVSHPHSEAASITGGFVYHGSRLPELRGAYIYGDFQSGKIWGLRHDGDKVTWQKELANTPLALVAFGEDRNSELYLLDYERTRGLHRLVPNPDEKPNLNFPKQLSQTGLFTSVTSQTPSAGVLPYDINAHHWADHAVSERWMALPGANPITWVPRPGADASLKDDGNWQFPEGAVLAKTVSIDMEQGNPASRRRLETQILHREQETWRPYTYLWNETQDDAQLVDTNGRNVALTIRDPSAPGGTRQQTYRVASRAECQLCHNPWVEKKTTVYGVQTASPLGVSPAQLRCQSKSNSEDQLTTLKSLGWVSGQLPAADAPRFVDPYDAGADLNQRARSYLHVNCSHCHQLHAGGATTIDLLFESKLEKARILDVRPTQGAFGITHARVIAPGDPLGSVLHYRMSKVGGGRMPRLGSEEVDEAGVRLVYQWIAQLPQTGGDSRPTDFAEQLTKLKSATANDRAEAIRQILSSTRGALALLRELDGKGLLPDTRQAVVSIAGEHSQPEVRDLFERFIPASQRQKRLGSSIDRVELLAMPADAERGRQLFFREGTASCKACHRIKDQGENLGPDLSQIGKKYPPAELLTHVLEPSKLIDPKYTLYVLETADGQVLNGLLVEKTEQEVVLKSPQNKLLKVPANQVEQLAPQQKSLMPDLLLRDLTPQQAADLLAFLGSLK